MFLKKVGYIKKRGDEKRKGALIHLSALWVYVMRTYDLGLISSMRLGGRNKVRKNQLGQFVFIA